MLDVKRWITLCGHHSVRMGFNGKYHFCSFRFTLPPLNCQFLLQTEIQVFENICASYNHNPFLMGDKSVWINKKKRWQYKLWVWKCFYFKPSEWLCMNWNERPSKCSLHLKLKLNIEAIIKGNSNIQIRCNLGQSIAFFV